jgi:hypothetical protein
MNDLTNEVATAGSRSGALADAVAAFYLLMSCTVFALVPYRWIGRWMVSGRHATAVFSPAEISAAMTTRRRLAALILRFPALGSCVPHAMAALAMLRRRGIDADVHFGVLCNPPSGLPLEAHVWVTVGDVVVAGESVMSAFVELTPFA